MRNWILVYAVFAFSTGAFASWYWPFGDDDKKEVRMSELMEPATKFIDEASDYADDGKVDEALKAYRNALAELNRIELENPDRVDKPEFATVRNKRAYIESSIDSMLLKQAHDNARAVSVTDTTELEKKYAEELKAEASAGRARKPSTSASEAEESTDAPATGVKAQMIEARNLFRDADYETALDKIDEILDERPNYAPALNLRGLVELASGRAAEAEKTFDQLIRSNPDFYQGYYNMARIILQTRGDKGKDAARRYYETGRDYYNGPVDKSLEEKLK